MENMNIVINGKYKGYKIVFDEGNNLIQLKYKKKIILLNGNIKTIGITGNKLGTENLHYFELLDSTEKIYCLLDFNIYLILIILGMQVSAECVMG